MARSQQQERTKQVRFSCQAPDAKVVHLAGTFNGWDPRATPMAKRARGEWARELELAPGRYEYKFVVDGRWCCEPGQPDTPARAPGCVCNEHGTMNRVIEVQ
ncbi:MAG: glycogen-binding domain-containing protein [Phycisphaerae bacterium]|jgi:1,4-alpha-glucan branching enzyme|nr:glycoside hydrolase family 13 [Phycisphaerae bacterium]MCZ2399242.1 glycogen-binding domain-containing protein [Phycisphaerae bacterium]